MPNARAGGASPPQSEWSRRPEARVDGGSVTLSGLVTDDRGVAHVVVFAGEDKVFFEGSSSSSSPVRSVPFTATVSIQDERVPFVVIATDTDGLVHTVSAATVLGSSGLTAQRRE